jgi:catechol 2,3-dioxygenase-like lactoylglutathione lyase family enzyme
MTLHGIHHVGLTVSNLDRSVDFYERVFGGSRVMSFDLPTDRVQALLNSVRTDISGKVCWVRLPGAALELFAFTPGHAAEPIVWNEPGCTHFAMRVTDVHGWHARLTEHGVPCLAPPKQHGAAWFFYAADPDGNLIELIETTVV